MSAFASRTSRQQDMWRQNNEPNPILVAIRKSEVDLVEWHIAIFSTEIYGGIKAWEVEGHPFRVLTTVTDEQLDHADRVLDRLIRARETVR